MADASAQLSRARDRHEAGGTHLQRGRETLRRNLQHGSIQRRMGQRVARDSQDESPLFRRVGWRWPIWLIRIAKFETVHVGRTSLAKHPFGPGVSVNRA